MHEYLNQLTLRYGDGAVGQSVCWLRSLELHQFGEHGLLAAGCTICDPVVQQMCVHINDAYGSGHKQRTTDILDFGYFRPLGVVPEEISAQRLWHLADAVVRRVLPAQLIGRPAWDTARRMLLALPCITDRQVALDCAMRVTQHRMYWATAADGPEYLLGSVATMLYSMCAQMGLAAHALLALTPAVSRAHRELLPAHHHFIKEQLFPLLAELLEIGKPDVVIPDEPVNGVDAFLQACGAGHAHADA